MLFFCRLIADAKMQMSPMLLTFLFLKTIFNWVNQSIASISNLTVHVQDYFCAPSRIFSFVCCTHFWKLKLSYYIFLSCTLSTFFLLRLRFFCALNHIFCRLCFSVYFSSFMSCIVVYCHTLWFLVSWLGISFCY